MTTISHRPVAPHVEKQQPLDSATAISVRQVLNDTSLRQLLQAKPVFYEPGILSVSESDTIKKALQILGSNEFHAVAVLKQTAKMEPEGASPSDYLGWVDQIDVVAYFVRIVKDKLSKQKEGTEINWKEIEENLKTTKIGEVIRAYERCPIAKNFVSLSDSESVLHLCENVFLKHIPRAMVMEGDTNKVIGVATAMDVIRLLHTRAPHIKALNERTVGDLMSVGVLTPSPVQTISMQMRALDAFALMEEKHVSALVITDSGGKLFATLTASDAKRLHSWQTMGTFLSNVVEFLVASNPGPLAPVTVTKASSFENLISRMVMFRIHQVLLVQDDAPLGFISTQSIVEMLHRVCAPEATESPGA